MSDAHVSVFCRGRGVKVKMNDILFSKFTVGAKVETVGLSNLDDAFLGEVTTTDPWNVDDPRISSKVFLGEEMSSLRWMPCPYGRPPDSVPQLKVSTSDLDLGFVSCATF